MLAELQRQMAAAVHGDASAFGVSVADVRPGGIDPRKRLYLHRSTVRANLLAVLHQAFPVTAAVLGETAFDAAGTAFMQVAPPRRAILSSYGAGFPDFLDRKSSDGVPGITSRGLPARLARIDWAANAAYFAADGTPLSARLLLTIDPEAQARLRFRPLPSAALLSVDPATWAVWRRHADAVELALTDAAVPSAALVWRNPLNRVCVRAVSTGEEVLLRSLFAGKTLLEAAEAGSAADDKLDLPSVLAAAIGGGAFAADDPSIGDEAKPDA